MTDQTPSTEQVRYGYRTGVTAPILPVEAGDAFDAWLAARDREVAAKALSSLSAEFTRMSLELQESDRYAEDYWQGAAQALADAAQLAEDRADRIGAGDE